MRQRLIYIGDTLLAFVAWGLFGLFLAFFLSRDVYVAGDTAGRVRAYIRDVEFDFLDWTVGALRDKLTQASVDEQDFLDPSDRSRLVRDYFALRVELEGVEREIATAYGDPEVSDPAAATEDLRAEQASLRLRAGRVQPLAEAILEEQLSVILARQGLAFAGQPVPPVAFRFTPLPYALIVSPRDEIRAEANLDVSGDLTLDELVALEDEIAEAQDVSTLIIPLGGIGTYPTMVAQTSDLNWAVSVIAHEWIHNYLTLRPLGLNYLTSPDLRTMNETTAEMIGNELGQFVLKHYYPDQAPAPPPFENRVRHDQPATEAAESFDFRAAMHETRVTADRLLSEGKIEAAEAYMEARRRVLWDKGYQIRKLNQAYFAFYGAYPAGGGGAAGTDPVGAAVRLLRRRSPSIAHFVNTMAGFTSYEQLRDHLGLPEE